MEGKLNISQKYVVVSNKSNVTFGYVRKGIVSRDMEIMIPLHSAIVKYHLEN